MHNGDALLVKGVGQGFGVSDQFGRGDPERGADEVTDPDFLEGHVEGHGEPLVDSVRFADAEDGILASE